MGKRNHCFHLIRCVCPIGVAIQTVSIVFVKGGEGLFLPGSCRGWGSWVHSPGRLDLSPLSGKFQFLKGDNQLSNERELGDRKGWESGRKWPSYPGVLPLPGAKMPSLEDKLS